MTKRKIILAFIAAGFLLLLGASVFLMKQKQNFKRSIAVIPEFCLPQAIDSLMFCHTQLSQGKPVVIIYFHTECDFCHAKAQQLQQKTDTAGNIQWVFVSFAHNYSVNKFMETYDLADIPNLVVLVDPQFLLYERLKVTAIPTSYIYDRRHRLVTVKRGAAKLETLIQLANR